MKLRTIVFIFLLFALACKKDVIVIVNQDSSPKKYVIGTIGPRDRIIFDFDNDNIDDFEFYASDTYSGNDGRRTYFRIAILNNTFSYSGINFLDTLYRDTTQIIYQGFPVQQIRHHNDPNGLHIDTILPREIVNVYDSASVQTAIFTGINSNDGIVYNYYANNNDAPFNIYSYTIGARKDGFILVKDSNTNIIYKIYIEIANVQNGLYVYEPTIL